MDNVREEADKLFGTPKLNSHYVPIAVSEDEIQFRVGPWSGPIYHLRDKNFEGKLTAFVNSLDGSRAAAELLDGRDERVVLALLRELYRLGIAYDASHGESRVSVREYSLLRPDYGGGDMADQSILVVGPSTLSTTLLTDLAEIQSVETTYLRTDGPEGDSPADRTLPFEEGDIETLIPDSDFVVYTSDSPNPALAQAVNLVTHEHGIPWSSGRVHGLDGVVGPSVLPGETPCYNCYRERAYGTIRNADDYWDYERVASPPARFDAFGRVVASYLFFEVLDALQTGFCFTFGTTMSFDFFARSVESNNVLKLPRCPVCSTAADAPGERELLSAIETANAGRRGEP